jgi:hypothetical protein
MEVIAVVAAVEVVVAEIFLVGWAGLGLVRFVRDFVGEVVGAYVHVPPGHGF